MDEREKRKITSLLSTAFCVVHAMSCVVVSTRHLHPFASRLISNPVRAKTIFAATRSPRLSLFPTRLFFSARTTQGALFIQESREIKSISPAAGRRFFIKLKNASLFPGARESRKNESRTSRSPSRDGSFVFGSARDDESRIRVRHVFRRNAKRTELVACEEKEIENGTNTSDKKKNKKAMRGAREQAKGK